MLGAAGAAAAGAAAASRSPVAIFVKRMSVPSAARSSWTIRLGMSTLAGMALPRRTTSVKSDSNAFSALFACVGRRLGGVEARLLLGQLVGGHRRLVPLGTEDQEPVAREDHQRDDQHQDLAIAIGDGHDPPPREAGTLRAPRGASVAGEVALNVTVMSYL